MSKNPMDMLDDVNTTKPSNNIVSLIESDLKIKQIINAIAVYEKNDLITTELIDFIKLILEV